MFVWILLGGLVTLLVGLGLLVALARFVWILLGVLTAPLPATLI